MIGPSQSISLLATHLSAVSNNMRYSLVAMSTDFGAADRCIRTEDHQLYTLSSLAHSTHGIKSLEQIDPRYHLSLTPWPPWPGSCIYLALGRWSMCRRTDLQQQAKPPTMCLLRLVARG